MNAPQLQRQLALETKRFNKAVEEATNVYANNIKKLQGRMSNYMNTDTVKKAAKGVTATRKIKKPCKSRGYGMGRRGKC